MSKRFGMMMVACGVVAGHAMAQTAGMQSFQGLIKDAAGNPVTSPVTLEFRIYDASVGGNLIDMDGDGVVENVIGQDAKQVLNTTPSGGVVSTKFGPVHPKAFNGGARWLEVRVGGTPLSRLEMATAPAVAEQINIPGTGTSRIAVNAAGHVGIATAVPGKTLQVGDSTVSNSEGVIRLASRSGTNTMNRTWDVGVRETDADTSTTGYDFIIDDIAAGGAGQAEFVIDHITRNVGIGTNAPQAKLDVAGTARMQVCTITGGADLAEPFDVSRASKDGGEIEPGMVVVIDLRNPGKLIQASEPYDRKVAGVISGANGLSPGMVMRAEGDAYADGMHNVALTGRVWARCDASLGAIEPGDRLTTSGVPGHAMKVADATRADGAVIGKAMTPLKEGRGLVLVLVQPQ